MSAILSRRDVGYTIASRLEEAFRAFIANKIVSLYADFFEGIPIGIVEKAKDRTDVTVWDDPIDFLENTDFPDLKEIVCFNKSYSTYFPDAELTQSDFAKEMDDFYQQRCKIAHIKKHYSAFDIDKLLDSSIKIATLLGDYGREFVDFTTAVTERPEEVVLEAPVGFFDGEVGPTPIPHNVPTPDYEYEGGFVGRVEDIRKVKALLEGRHNVVTISGAGGVGKTSLALKVVQQLLESKVQVFEGVVWLSAKEDVLSYLGIVDTEPTLKNYGELLDAIFSVMGFENPSGDIAKKERDVATVFNLYPRVLIVIDNFETIVDDRIADFVFDIEEKYPEVKILITSRRGLGQVERRYDLRQLKEKEAINLFRRVSIEKGISTLAKVDDESIKFYVTKLACYPLAIKWVIGQVAIGKDINSVVDAIHETTSDISKFSFEQIYNSINSNSRRILCALSIMDEKPPVGLLNYVVGIEKNDLEDGLHELVLVSLVVPEVQSVNGQEISMTYSLLSLTRGYVRQRLDENINVKRELVARLDQFQSNIEDAERAKEQIKVGLANLGAISEDEKVAAMLVQSAFQKSQLGQYAESVADYKRAAQIAPRFSSIYRNWAVMEAHEQHFPECEKLFEKAAGLNPLDTQMWLAWGDVNRKRGKIDEALTKYEKAYKISPRNRFVLNSYGQAVARNGQYEEANDLFYRSLHDGEGELSLQSEIINITSVTRNFLRWAEQEVKSGKFSSAEDKLNKALSSCERLIELDERDERSQEVYRDVHRNLGFLYCNANNPNRDNEKSLSHFLKAIVRKNIKYMRFKESRDTAEAALHAGRILCALGRLDDARKIFPRNVKKNIEQPLREIPSLRAKVDNLWNRLYSDEKEFNDIDRKKGVVRLYHSKDGYGFISCDTGEDVFFHCSRTRNRDTSEIRVGRNASFVIRNKPKGLEAEDVCFDDIQ